MREIEKVFATNLYFYLIFMSNFYVKKLKRRKEVINIHRLVRVHVLLSVSTFKALINE